MTCKSRDEIERSPLVYTVTSFYSYPSSQTHWEVQTRSSVKLVALPSSADEFLESVIIE